jgi:hypothetical protein
LNRVSKNKTLRSVGLAAGLSLAVISAAQAHPGHGKATTDASGTSATHYVTEPVHAVTLVAAAVAMTLGVTYVARRITAHQ